jgi:hypothetical protein
MSGWVQGPPLSGLHPEAKFPISTGIHSAPIVCLDCHKLEKGLAAKEPDDSVGGRLKAKADGVKTRAEDSLAAGSVAIAIVAGLFVAAPTPFQLTAVGEMVRQDYPFVLQLALLVVVSLVTYIVVEIPVVSYALRPETTAARVTAFSAWLDANKIQAAAALAAVIGVILVIKGLAFS